MLVSNTFLDSIHYSIFFFFVKWSMTDQKTKNHEISKYTKFYHKSCLFVLRKWEIYYVME